MRLAKLSSFSSVLTPKRCPAAFNSGIPMIDSMMIALHGSSAMQGTYLVARGASVEVHRARSA